MKELISITFILTAFLNGCISSNAIYIHEKNMDKKINQLTYYVNGERVEASFYNQLFNELKKEQSHFQTEETNTTFTSNYILKDIKGNSYQVYETVDLKSNKPIIYSINIINKK